MKNPPLQHCGCGLNYNYQTVISSAIPLESVLQLYLRAVLLIFQHPGLLISVAGHLVLEQYNHCSVLSGP